MTTLTSKHAVTANTVALAGLGVVGQRLVKAFAEGKFSHLTLTAVSARNVERANEFLKTQGLNLPVVPLADLSSGAAIVVEALPPEEFTAIADMVIQQGKTFVPMSCGNLIERSDLIEVAKRTGAKIIAPSGGIVGLDGIRAAAVGNIHKISFVTRKHPHSLAGAPYLVENNIDLSKLEKPICVFSGTVREAIKAFPANVNVAAAVSLAGVGPDKTHAELWADTSTDRVRHKVTVESDTASFSIEIQSIPSIENPRTGLLTPQSLIACLQRLEAPATFGS